VDDDSEPGLPIAGTHRYDEVVAARRARLTPESHERRKGLEYAYDIAMQVIELREKRGMTQAELAKRCGVDQGDISRIERGETSPTTRTLQRIADALGAQVRLVERAS
jgi:ribosome-binding protein aMBF1 (putative translation factor)